jgi:hypothetical protein
MPRKSGLDRVAKDFEEASKALSQLDGTLGEVNFDPNDPASIERAINAVNSMVDEKTIGFENNPIIEPLVREMKEKYRDAILENAAAARLEGEPKND